MAGDGRDLASGVAGASISAEAIKEERNRVDRKRRMDRERDGGGERERQAGRAGEVERER